MADFELMIDPAGLEGASTQYTTAAGKFSNAVTELKGKLESALSVWEDSSKDTWTTRVNKACTDLDGIRELLEGNATALKEIADYATNSEKAVSDGISTL